MARYRRKAPMKRRKNMARRKYGKRKVNQAKPVLIRRLGQIIRITQTGNAGTPATSVTVPSSGSSSCAISVVQSDTMSNTVQFGNSFLFKLSSVIDSQEFVSLFDRYKIAGVKLRIMYQAESASVGGAGILPIINWCSDFDDAVAPTTFTAVAAKAKARSTVLTANRPLNVYIRPRVAQQLGDATQITSGFGVARSMYINSTYPDCAHYGFKTYIQNFYAPTGANNQITIQPTYYLALKDPQ